jgi:uncharacterized protein YbjT (DUF2867 family)
MKVLVIGGTGTVGSQVVLELLKRGEPVRVMTRSPEKLHSLPQGAEGRLGDLQDPSSLPALLDGVDRMFLLTALSRSETAEGLAAVHAAKQAGVRRLVYMSVHRLESAPHIPHFASKIPIEREIKQSGIAYTIVRPNSFFQNDLWLKEAILHGIYPQPIGNVGMNRVDVRDIAEAAVNALTRSRPEGQTYALVGPDALTGESAAAIYSRHFGRAVRYAGDDLDAWAQQARNMMPGWLVADLRVMFEHFQKKGLAASAADWSQTHEALGHAPRSFDTFVAEVAQAWKVE